MSGPRVNAGGSADRPALVRCPSERCGRQFRILPEWLGRNLYCPACGVRMTARPVSAGAALRERERSVTGGAGDGPARLPLVALVDNVRSLWNVGSIFRTADACGIRELVLTGITGCPPRPEITKTALGAERVVAWSYHAEPLEAIERLRVEGYTPVALETTERAVGVEAVRWPSRTCLVVGNEVSGVSSALLEASRLHVRIPMRGVKNSLNVAVAFGIAAAQAAAVLAAAACRDRHGGDSG